MTHRKREYVKKNRPQCHSGNLDDENTAAIMQLLREQVAEKGFCVIIVTHDPEVAAACDVCYRMHNGSLTESTGE